MRTELHKHICPACYHVWEHRTSDIPAGRLHEAHTCPKCGRHSFVRYDGKAPALENHSGRLAHQTK